jgi:putative intracellular protease/amidase
MHIALLTFDGFPELDVFVALGLLNRIQRPGWRVSIAAPAASVTSRHGHVVAAPTRLDELARADAVLVTGGPAPVGLAPGPTPDPTPGCVPSRAPDTEAIHGLRLDPTRQLVGAQGAGTLLLARLGLLGGVHGAVPGCTDAATRSEVEDAGVEVLDMPFYAQGGIATASGGLASAYLAAWVIARTEGADVAREALRAIAPLGEEASFADRAMAHVTPCLPIAGAAASLPALQVLAGPAALQQGFAGRALRAVAR